MSENYFASVYDHLMKDAPYDLWLQYAKNRLPNQGKIVDLACGTGTFAIGLKRLGYDVIGVDLSQDMLTVAESKVRKYNQTIPLLQQDMRSFTGFTNLDGVTIFCDGLNYLLEEKDVQETFLHVNKALRQGGVFLFDVHSTYKLEETFHDELYGENGEDISYLWFTSPTDQAFSVEHILTFFVKSSEDNNYARLDEIHKQRTFPAEDYVEWLKDAGFEHIEVTSNFGRNDVTGKEDRIFFRAIKK